MNTDDSLSRSRDMTKSDRKYYRLYLQSPVKYIALVFVITLRWRYCLTICIRADAGWRIKPAKNTTMHSLKQLKIRGGYDYRAGHRPRHDVSNRWRSSMAAMKKCMRPLVTRPTSFIITRRNQAPEKPCWLRPILLIFVPGSRRQRRIASVTHRRRYCWCTAPIIRI